jgi:hypothetical protein
LQFNTLCNILKSHVLQFAVATPVVSLPHLKRLKKATGRPQDLADIATPEAKLNWLEEANRFVNDFLSPSKLERWKKISGR